MNSCGNANEALDGIKTALVVKRREQLSANDVVVVTTAHTSGEHALPQWAPHEDT
ncbi:hypothetical protein TUM20983_23510 [Mycobacterium antarcticum]|nr:hypothetical protein [Mycolicibacterium sp. TUM20983]GLP75241.1 hypothetical protein TUM20983_23510 [Mycolicibacterium sp. TUM20983]